MTVLLSIRSDLTVASLPQVHLARQYSRPRAASSSESKAGRPSRPTTVSLANGTDNEWKEFYRENNG
jgi:hypothetical protein